MNPIKQDWWEYAVVTQKTAVEDGSDVGLIRSALEDLLNRHGCQGYELTAVVPISVSGQVEALGYSNLIFKRPTNVDYAGIEADRQVK